MCARVQGARRCPVMLFTALLVMGAVVPAYAVNLPPGDTVVLGHEVKPGTVIYDALIDFQINVTGSTSPLFKGKLQNRVVRLDATGKLQFSYMIRDTQRGLNGIVASITTVDFSDRPTNVNYDVTSPGTVAPSHASRSGGDGAAVVFRFVEDRLFSGLESEFMEIETDAELYASRGRTTITLTTGESVVLRTVTPVTDTTPPVVAITSPAPLECVCNPVKIFGTARDPESFESYILEYATDPGGPWSPIVVSNTPVVAGLLGTWDVTALPQGYYFIRLTATNLVDLTSSVTTIVFVDKQFDVVDVRSPADGGIYGGWVCFDGTINDGNGGCPVQYRLDYRPAAGGIFSPVDPAKPVYTGPVINDPLGSWNTRAGIADGEYIVRVTGIDGCGHTKAVSRKVVVDNTAPIAVITEPTSCSCVKDELVKIVGTASDAHLAGWTVQYTGGDAHGWVTIASGNTSVINDTLATWDTRRLKPCAYTIRLVVSDRSGIDCSGYTNQTEYYVSLDVGQCCQPDGTPPRLLGAASRKIHGLAGAFDIDLPLDPTTSPGIECRADGPTRLVLKFDEPIQAVDGTPDGTEVTLSAGLLGAVSIAVNQMIIDLSDVADQSCLAVSLSGVADLAGNALAGPSSFHVVALQGDVTDDNLVASADITQVKARSGQTTEPTNYRHDVNADGIVASADITQVKARSGHSASCP